MVAGREAPRIEILGSVRVVGADGQERVRLDKSLALLTVLAASPTQPISRDRVFGLLWPDVSESSARHSLSSALYQVRQELGPESIRSIGSALQIDRSVVWVDLLEFRAAVEGEAWDRAVEVYGGSLLDGLTTGGPALEDWLADRLQELERDYGHACELLADQAESEGDVEAAIAHLRSLCSKAPLHARTNENLVRLLYESGDSAEALLQARRHEQALRDELDLSPSSTLQALIGKILEGAEGASLGAPGSTATEETTRHASEVPVPAEVSTSSPRTTLRWAGVRMPQVLVGFALAAVVATVALVTRSSGARTPAGVQAILADFASDEADASLARTVTDAIRIDLVGSGVLHLLPETQVQSALRRMGEEASVRLNGIQARSIAVREGIEAVLEGEVRRAGTGFVLLARLIDPSDGSAVPGAARRVSAADSTDLLNAIDQLSRDFLSALGESTSSIAERAPLAQVTTRSLEALERYTEAQRLLATDTQLPRALSLLEESVALDPGFAKAQASLAKLYLAFGQFAKSIEAIGMAYLGAEELPEVERIEIEALYILLVEDDSDRAAAVNRRVLELDTTDPMRLADAAFIFRFAEDWDGVVQASAASQAIDPSYLAGYRYLPEALWRLDRGAEAEEVLRSMEQIFTDNRIVDQEWSTWLTVSGRYVEANTRLEHAKRMGPPTQEAGVSFTQGGLALIQGRLVLADSLDRDTEDRYRTAGAGLAASRVALRRAMVDVVFRGDTVGAITLADSVAAEFYRLDLPVQGSPLLSLAAVYSQTGAHERASFALSRFDSLLTVHPAAFGWGALRHQIYASLRLSEQRYDSAGWHLDQARPARFCAVCGLHIRGAIELASGDTLGAIRAYTEFIETPQWNRAFYGTASQMADPFWLGLTFERLGELHRARGDSGLAEQYFRRLAVLWQNADPDLLHRIERRGVQTGVTGSSP